MTWKRGTHVASYARNLGEFVQDGKPTATFRHEIPTYLSGTHKTFVQYGYAMANKYGKNFRRNVRFDDVTQSLCMDVKMPGTEKWITVSHDRVLADLKAARLVVEKESAGQLSSLGDTPSPNQDEATLGVPHSGAPEPNGGAGSAGGASCSTGTSGATGHSAPAAGAWGSGL